MLLECKQNPFPCRLLLDPTTKWIPEKKYWFILCPGNDDERRGLVRPKNGFVLEMGWRTDWLRTRGDHGELHVRISALKFKQDDSALNGVEQRDTCWNKGGGWGERMEQDMNCRPRQISAFRNSRKEDVEEEEGDRTAAAFTGLCSESTRVSAAARDNFSQ